MGSDMSAGCQHVCASYIQTICTGPVEAHPGPAPTQVLVSTSWVLTRGLGIDVCLRLDESDLLYSRGVIKLLEFIGTGALSVHAAVDICREFVQELRVRFICPQRAPKNPIDFETNGAVSDPAGGTGSGNKALCFEMMLRPGSSNAALRGMNQTRRMVFHRKALDSLWTGWEKDGATMRRRDRYIGSKGIALGGPA